MAEEIWVAGYPSMFGGADTALDHNIDLWRQHDVDVNLVPLWGCDQRMRQLCDDRGCRTHQFHRKIFAGKVVVSFCNGDFLRLLPEIVSEGRPAVAVWFNCMTWPFDAEKVAIQNGWIDLVGFVSSYQRKILKPLLEAAGRIAELEDYRPYFNPENITQSLRFAERSPGDFFGVGRVSRDDAGKFSRDMWTIFHKVCVPRSKKVFILGYGDNAAAKVGAPPVGLDWMTWSPNAIPVRDFYDRIHCLIHKTGGSRESYGRTVPEAYASGVGVVVEDDFAFPELVDNGITGFRCKNSDEMSFRAKSACAIWRQL